MLTYNLWKTPKNTIFIRFSKYFQHFIMVKSTLRKKNFRDFHKRIHTFEDWINHLKMLWSEELFFIFELFSISLHPTYFLRIPIHILDSVSLLKNFTWIYLKSMLEYFYMVWKIKTLDFSCFFSTHIAAEVVRPNQTFFLSLK